MKLKGENYWHITLQKLKIRGYDCKNVDTSGVSEVSPMFLINNAILVYEYTTAIQLWWCDSKNQFFFLFFFL